MDGYNQMKRENLELQKKILDGEEKESLLLERISRLENQQQNQELNMSYAGVVAEEPTTKEDKMMAKMD